MSSRTIVTKLQKHGYKAGTLFGVPLGDETYAVGLVTRADKSGGVLAGCFFGPRRKKLPDLDELEHLRSKNAILVCRFGDLGLRDGIWPVIGTIRTFSRSDWPLPRFLRRDESRAELIEYHDDDLVEERSVERIYGQIPTEYPKDGLSGYVAVQIKLNLLIPAGFDSI